MSTRSYVGAAPLAAKVYTITPGGTIAATDTFAVTCGGTTFTFTATTTTVAHVTAGLYALIAAAQTAGSSLEWAPLTAADATTALTVTTTTPGEDFTLTVAVSNVSGGAAPTLTLTTTTANSGPEQYDNALNWSSATLPVDNDTIVIEGNYNLRYGTLASVTPARVIIRDFSGTIGLPPINANGRYPEYRSQYMLLGNAADAIAMTWDFMGNITSGLMRLSAADAQVTVNVYSTGTPSDPTIAALTLIGTHASNVLNVLSGSVASASESGEASTWANWRTGEGTFAGALDLELGLGCTLTTGTQGGGIVRLVNDCATVVVDGGTLFLIDDPDIGTKLTINENATVVVVGGPTITAMLIQGGKLDATKDIRPFTITSSSVGIGSVIDDKFSRITLTNPQVFIGGATLKNTTIDYGPNRSLAVT